MNRAPQLWAFSLLLAAVWACSTPAGDGPDVVEDAGPDRSVPADVSSEAGHEIGDLSGAEASLEAEAFADLAAEQDSGAGDIPTGDELAEPPSSELSVLTFNLHCHHDEPEKRFKMVVDVAVEWGVRVLALQEVCEGGELENTAKTLAGLLDEATGIEHSVLFTTTHVAWDTYQEGLGLVFAGQMTHSEAFDLPPGLFPRKALWARVVDGGEIYDVVVTHLSFGDQQADIRLQQAEALQGVLVEKILPYASGPVILAGDFNTSLTSQPVGIYTAEGWTEAFAHLHPDQPGYTYPAGSAKAKIDHLLLFDGSYDEILAADVVLDQSQDGLYPSDHYGIAATFSF